MKSLSIVNDKGRHFRCCLLEEGEEYGRHGVIGDPLIEFYDMTADNHGPSGQFVSGYCAVTMLNRGRDVGLDLDGGSPAWQIDGKTMNTVVDWLRKVIV